MFDVKTPLRTYYLAANSEEDMNAWVNCICEVCNLQDLSKPQQQNNENRQCKFSFLFSVIGINTLIQIYALHTLVDSIFKSICILLPYL